MEPTHVHQCWQIDFKLGIAIGNEQLVNLHTVRDPVGEACVGAVVFPAGQVGHHPPRPTSERARYALRTSFAH